MRYDLVHRTGRRMGSGQSYIRDILNDAETVRDWRPSRALPLAMAIAESRSRGVSASKLLGDARSRLISWYDAVSDGDSACLTYTDQLFDDHVRTLDERAVFRNREFTSCLLEDWLLGLHKTIDEPEWRDLLISSAIKRIRLPRLRKKITDAEGGEAAVSVGVSAGETLACRIARLKSAEDKLRFADTKQILERLKQSRDGGMLGARYVFQVLDVGLSADDENETLQVYRWVEGVDLSRRLGELGGRYTAEIGAKLAHGLHFIHSQNVLHRDLTPKNVIIEEESGEPVIIDFGFARRITDKMLSIRDSKFAAQEVRLDSPKWTKAADVFGLGATLLEALDPGEKSDSVKGVIDLCMAAKPEDRPDAKALVRLFESAKEELGVEQRKREAVRSAQEACSMDYQSKRWFKDLVDKFSGNFEGAALGCWKLQFDRCRVVAAFLDQALEAYSREKRLSETLKLGLIKNDSSRFGNAGNPEALQFMHSLRTYNAHGKGKPKLSYSEVQMLGLCTDAARQVRAIVQVGSLELLAGMLAAQQNWG